MESFNAILKKEEVNLHEYKTFEKAKRVIFENKKRTYDSNTIHPPNNNTTPDEIEKQAI